MIIRESRSSAYGVPQLRVTLGDEVGAAANGRVMWMTTRGARKSCTVTIRCTATS